MSKTRTIIAALVLVVAGVLFAGASPAHAAGAYKCDTNSPQWDVDICVRTNASKQTDGTGYKMSSIRVWATGDPSTLEDCWAFTTAVTLKRADGTVITSRNAGACKGGDYSVTIDFWDTKFQGNAVVTVRAQMYDNGDPDPDPAYITLPAVD